MPQLLSANPYIPWDTTMFLTAMNGLNSSIGVAFNVGFWLFIGIVGIVLVKNLISYFLE